MALPMPPETRNQIRQLCKLEGTSWSTLLLLLLAYLIWFAALFLTWRGDMPLWALALVASMAFTIGYTPLHEAVHGAVSSVGWINDWAGRLSSSLLMAPFKGYRYVHLKHHRFTNRQGVDPDLWSAESFLLFRWLTQDLRYYVIYLLERKKNRIKVRIEVVVQAAILLGAAYWLWQQGFMGLVLFGWLIPGRLTIAWLSFTFNFLPHHPHDEKLQDSVYKETNVRPGRLLDYLFFYQNYHMIHHLHPSAPFHRYGKIWNLGKDHYLAEGTQIKRVFEL